MASLMKICRIPTQLSQNKSVFLYNVVRNHWNKDWKPGQYPTTEEQRRKAAEKYGIPIEEYKTYPDDGLGYGDYPKLPDISGEGKDPFYPWDFPEHKRNFNETFHANADAIGEDRLDVSARLRYSHSHYWTWFLGTIAGFGVLFYLLEDYKLFRPTMKKQLPNAGTTHYTFEPLD